MLKSRAYILIGNSETWSSTKLEALRKLNHSLHGIEVLTYHDLIVRGQAYLNSSEVDDSVEEDGIPF